MALTAAEIQAIADAVWAKTLGPSSANDCAQKARVAAEKWGDGGTLTTKLNTVGSETQMALSNIAAGDVVVTGAAGGPWTLTWGGTQLGEDVAAPTTTESFTGGTTPDITIATTTAGGVATASDGTETFKGFLFTEVAFFPTSTKAAAPIMVHGQIDAAKLPVAFDPTDLPAGSNTEFVYKI